MNSEVPSACETQPYNRTVSFEVLWMRYDPFNKDKHFIACHKSAIFPCPCFAYQSAYQKYTVLVLVFQGLVSQGLVSQVRNFDFSTINNSSISMVREFSSVLFTSLRFTSPVRANTIAPFLTE